jgi:hypothetical protein
MYEVCTDRNAANARARAGAIAVLFFRGQTQIVFPAEYGTMTDKRIKQLLDEVYPREAEQFTGKLWRDDMLNEGCVDLEVPTCLFGEADVRDDTALQAFLSGLDRADRSCARRILAAHVRSETQKLIDILVECAPAHEADEHFREEVKQYIPRYILTAAFEYARTSAERKTIMQYLQPSGVP